MNLLPQYIATLFFPVFVGMVFVWPSVRTYRQTGINPVAFGKSDSAHDFIGRGFKVLLSAIALTIAASWSTSGLYHYLLPASFLATPVLQGGGAALCFVALVWTTVAQCQMGRSWRIGIDQKNKTSLTTTGLFSLSRNPVFLGLLTGLAGLLLLLPNALTLVCLVAGYLLIGVAIRLEEEHLIKQHGRAYQHYKARVRRLL